MTALPASRPASGLVHADPAIRNRIADAFAKVASRLGSKHSRRAYSQSWQSWLLWATENGVGVLEARPPDVQRWVDWSRGQYAPKTCSLRLITLKTIYSALVKEGLLAVNPASDLHVPGGMKTVRTPWLSEEDLRALVSVPARGWREQRDHAMVVAAVATAFRREGIATMVLGAFDPVKGTLRAGLKGGGELTLPLPAWATRELTRWLAERGGPKIDPGALFPVQQGRTAPVSGATVQGALERLGTRAGIPLERLKPHAIRRGVATMLDGARVHPRDIQRLLGHSSLAMTERYLKTMHRLKTSPLDVMGDMQAAEPAVAAVQAGRCPRCNAELTGAENAQFCGQCGVAFRIEERP